MKQEALGLELCKLGRAKDATEIFAHMWAERAYGVGSSHHARLLNNHGWSLVLAREAGEQMEDPLPLLESARELFDKLEERMEQRVNVRLSIALAHLQNGNPRSARAALDEAAALVEEPPAQQRLWWLDIEARLALTEGRAQGALELYERLDALAAGAFDPGGRWRAAIGRARAQKALGNRQEALSDLASAEALLDEQSLQVPLDQGRETFMAQRGKSARLYLELLLAEGRDAEALEVARRSRSRLLRALRYQDRLAELTPADRKRWESALDEYWRHRNALDEALADDWRLSVEELARARAERTHRSAALRRALDRAFSVFGAQTTTTLPALRPGELLLAYHPLPHGWVGFATRGGRIAVHRFDIPPDDAPPGALAEVLLDPFRGHIEASERIRILPFGVLREVDFHALPLGDDVLLAVRPVVYGLDLSPALASDVPRRALVVSDPRGDLLAARREARTVRDALAGGARPWRVELLEGREAGAEALGRRLGNVGLLHYAGHGVFSGRGGWSSALPLADGSRLTPGDLLALGRVPRHVVLSACDTARSASPGVESLGLAHGFLLAGAHQVVAAVRPVGDRATEELFRDFYRDWEGEGDLALRLRRAQLAWRGDGDGDGDWASFRVLER
jgi:tetratricopeptide (TPR) repeat protein